MNRNWNRHLKETLRNHFIPNELLLQNALAELTQLISLANATLPVRADGTIAGAIILSADRQVVNGVLHVIDRPLPTSFDTVSLADLIPNYYPHLVSVMDATNSSSLLSRQTPDGYSWIGCTEEDFNRMDEYLKGDSVLVEEFQNPQYASQTRNNVFLFNMVPHIYDTTLLGEGFLVVSATPCGNLWVTYKDGKLCFQDACVVGDAILANNGLALQTDRCLVCPGIVMSAAIDPNRKTLNTTDFVSVFRMTGWNERNLRPYFNNQTVTFAQPTSGLSEEVDAEQCFDLISTADEDGNDSLLRPEYNRLVAAYSEAKVKDAPETLSFNQQNVFIDMACLCRERGEGDACCEGTNAGILLSDDALKKELCQRINCNAPGNFCNDKTESAPSTPLEAQDP
ncbi:hypothetical protein FisN_UnNu060 [Fistulifera solaris]|uniref:FAS1 domain-containing protein n=1 Tax=Fistulifera solaris TaxID=1519565 RepID=A0A1Z5JPM0_FISSO|nr:hypothetical protein FisN_UnNu060 [Fistulifera solaris]|eukprot:GAX15909.1 hypothetical protein FisN_UnNu060 [Fistulifera solaris]